MRLKFLTSMAEQFGPGYEIGQVVDLPDHVAKRILAMVRGDDAEPLAVLVKAQVCPNCGHSLQEPEGQSGPETLESATVNHAPRRRG
jgi:hypothetical protein